MTVMVGQSEVDPIFYALLQKLYFNPYTEKWEESMLGNTLWSLLITLCNNDELWSAVRTNPEIVKFRDVEIRRGPGLQVGLTTLQAFNIACVIARTKKELGLA